MPAEYLKARAQLILSKAAAMDPAIGRRLTGIPAAPFWVDAITKELPPWGSAVPSSAVNWTELGTTVLAMINALQRSLNLPVWATIPGCSELTAITSADPIAPRQGESLITALDTVWINAARTSAL